MSFWRLSTLLWLSFFVGCTTAVCLPIISNLSNNTEGNLNLILTLSNSLTPVLEPFKSQNFSTRAARVLAVTTALKNATAVWQAPVLAALEPFKLETVSFWLTNQIFVKSASPTVVAMLKGLKGLESIAEDITIPIWPGLFPGDAPPPNNYTQWGVNKTEADKVWTQYGKRGEAIRIAFIDTGVRVTHESLRDNFLGEYGWYDPFGCTLKPNDTVGHGTHCAGIAAGRCGIGVAPNAKWMACKGCNKVNCLGSALTACGQFMALPTNATGGNPDITKVPHVVSNSWGGGQNDTWYNKVIASWLAVGIIPVFAIGNSGPKCSTANSPGDQPNVISVGSTNEADKVSDYSSRGPNINSTGTLVPYIGAPGESIISASYLNDTGYRYLSGTSMATPLVAGAVALLLSQDLRLKQNDIVRIFNESAICIPNSACGKTGAGDCPNYDCGVGRINILRAFSKIGNTQARINATEMQVYRPQNLRHLLPHNFKFV